MPVIVDPIRRYDHVRLSFEELHTFAAALGIPRHRFQGDHYDLPPWLRSRAVELGAEEVTTADLLVRMAGCGLRGVITIQMIGTADPSATSNARIGSNASFTG